MGILDIFRGAGRNPDPQARLVAIEQMSDEAALAEIACSDDSPRVRLAAIAKINDDAILAEVARTAGEIDVCIAAVERINSQRLLAEIVKLRKNYELMGTCFRCITDPKLLNEIANDPEYNPAARRMAVEQFADESFLEDVSQANAIEADRSGRKSDEAVDLILNTYGGIKVVRALGRFRGSPKALMALGTIARKGDDIGGLAVEYLCRALSSDNPSLRACAADELAMLTDAEMISVLVRSLDKSNLCTPIREILRRIDTPQARAALNENPDDSSST